MTDTQERKKYVRISDESLEAAGEHMGAEGIEAVFRTMVSPAKPDRWTTHFALSLIFGCAVLVGVIVFVLTVMYSRP